MKRATKDKVLKLEQLALDACASLYDRLCLARDVLADDDFLTEKHKGDQDAAMREEGARWFPDLVTGGVISLGRLLALLEAFPRREEWAHKDFSLQAMVAAWEEKRRAANGSEKSSRASVSYKALAEDREEEVKTLHYELSREREGREQASDLVTQLKAALAERDRQIATLTEENRELRVRVRELESILSMGRRAQVPSPELVA